MNKFVVGDEVTKKESYGSERGTIIDRVEYCKKKSIEYNSDYRISETSHCIEFKSDDFISVQVIPDDELEYHPDYISKLRDKKIKSLYE